MLLLFLLLLLVRSLSSVLRHILPGLRSSLLKGQAPLCCPLLLFVLLVVLLVLLTQCCPARRLCLCHRNGPIHLCIHLLEDRSTAEGGFDVGAHFGVVQGAGGLRPGVLTGLRPGLWSCAPARLCRMQRLVCREQSGLHILICRTRCCTTSAFALVVLHASRPLPPLPVLLPLRGCARGWSLALLSLAVGLLPPALAPVFAAAAGLGYQLRVVVRLLFCLRLRSGLTLLRARALLPIAGSSGPRRPLGGGPGGRRRGLGAAGAAAEGWRRPLHLPLPQSPLRRAAALAQGRRGARGGAGDDDDLLLEGNFPFHGRPPCCHLPQR
mmetsp:Transcript_170548/g.547022  ORF Transcript_170548/g.547022 Transcript_170548/m.547022 type:complete len:324 (+) Transcript_170548:1475-2446(+)